MFGCAGAPDVALLGRRGGGDGRQRPRVVAHPSPSAFDLARRRLLLQTSFFGWVEESRLFQPYYIMGTALLRRHSASFRGHHAAIN